MTDLEASQPVFDGVSLTPNIFTRAYDVARAVAFAGVAWWFARCGGDWAAQPNDDWAAQPGEDASQHLLYFH